MKLRAAQLSFFFLALESACTKFSGQLPPAGCADFLREKTEYPRQLRFVECRKSTHAQIETLVARYEAPGANAKLVEHFLHEKFGMARLRFACCGWENAGGKWGTYRDKNAFQHRVSMTSGETLEKNWAKIEKFTIDDEIFTTEP